ncbi:MAG: methyltransferase domain-containing protein [Rhodocyclaceae bacterium]|nr:methyltransferase domain-containing protein [Rhodocyclaceae bacterium]
MNVDPSTELERSRSNARARQTWETQAVGSQRATAPKGSRAYFEQIRDYRYGYETPFIPTFFNFADMRGKRVLEIGVGNGVDAVEMLRCGAVYTGIDITRNHLDLARRNIELVQDQNLTGRVENIVEGDLLEVSLPGNYDVVYAFGVLHHIAHEAEHLRRIYELLRPGGELKVALYSRYSFFNLWLVLTWLLKNRMRNTLEDWRSHLAECSPLGTPVVIKIRSKAEIQSLMARCGFEVVRYGKKGFVQAYLPGIGRFLAPDGHILNACAGVLGWYHCFICRRA